jgi:hypothetical protein
MDTNVATPSRITETRLCAWLGTAAPGDQLAYYRGFLAVDLASTDGALTKAERAELRRVARRALFAAENGLAHLLQRRNGPDDFTYLLIARPRPNVPKHSLQTVLAEGVASCPTSVGTSIR